LAYFHGGGSDFLFLFLFFEAKDRLTWIWFGLCSPTSKLALVFTSLLDLASALPLAFFGLGGGGGLMG
jgi:hypothetical protein